MTYSRASGEKAAFDLTRTAESFAAPVSISLDSDAEIDLTSNHSNEVIPVFVLQTLNSMIAHQVLELEHLERPDRLAPISEQQNFTYKTAEMYGGVEALTRLRETLQNTTDAKAEIPEKHNENRRTEKH